MNRKLILLPALFLFLAVVGVAEAQSKKDTPINVISYNIRMNTSGDGVNAWPLRKEKVFGLLKFHKADLFGVQEALPEQMDDLAAAFPDFDHVGVGRDDGKRAGEHMGIFYKKARFEKVEDGMFWLNEKLTEPGFGWDAVCNRTVTWIKLKDKITKKTFFAFNTHFDHRGVKARDESAKLILSKMKEINPEGLPMFLTGDFNLVKDSNPIQLILKELHDTRDKSVTPPYLPNGTSGGFEVKALNRTIDFIFVNDKLTVLRHGVISDSNGEWFPSDHLAVLAEIAVN
ncbi:MAG: endonuclease/exonuclease/phosphatase family protein [Bacteroidales bacterium]|nr:endonuclease/exonuclease/phosphatase family protein [Bacteroidales bacterium]MCU0408759.1 endonuclease/exonuclease/phosphatase family protein [Bacteroidales bacterium]